MKTITLKNNTPDIVYVQISGKEYMIKSGKTHHFVHEDDEKPVIDAGDNEIVESVNIIVREPR